MSIASEITRLQGAKSDIATAIAGKGVTVPEDAKYDDFADLIDDIQQGGAASLETESVSYTPTETAISEELTPSTGKDGFSKVDVAVAAIPSDYVGSAIHTGSSSDITFNITDSALLQSNSIMVADGYYENVSKSSVVANMQTSEATSVAIGSNGSATITFSPSAAGIGYTKKTYQLTKSNVVTPKTSSDLTATNDTVYVPAGYYDQNASKSIASASTPYGGFDSINSSGDVVFDVEIDTGGYIGAGTYRVTDSGAVTVQAAQTIYPSSSDQSIASGKYLTGAQTIKGVSYSNTLTAENIKKDVVIKIGDSSDDDRIVSVTGTYEGGGGGITPDGMASGSEPVGAVVLDTATSIRERAFAGCTNITSIHAKNLTSLKGYIVSGCTSLTTFVSEKQTTENFNVFSGASQLTAIDINHKGSPSNGFFANCASLTTLILRRTDAITSLASTAAFNGTPFANGGTGGEIFVPQAYLSTYPTATNWVTINGYGTVTWKKIEGSYYETHYADGTAIS